MNNQTTEQIESLDQFIQALEYDINMFKKVYRDPIMGGEPRTRIQWFDLLMGEFEYGGLGNMKKAIEAYNSSLSDE